MIIPIVPLAANLLLAVRNVPIDRKFGRAGQRNHWGGPLLAFCDFERGPLFRCC